MRSLRVLIVDDSVVVQHLVWRVLRESADIEVVGMVSNGRAALARLAEDLPDVMLLDVEMPVMGGLEVLDALRKVAPRLPVIVFSAQAERGALVTLEALARGAADYLAKPSGAGGPEAAAAYLRAELVPRLHALTSRARGVAAPGLVAPSPVQPPLAAAARHGPVDVVVIGSSAGGPNALGTLLAELDADFPVPIVVAQHMPAKFTRLLADRLAARCRLAVCEAETGLVLRPGQVVVAAGHAHLLLERGAGPGGPVLARVRHEDVPGIDCKPAVDLLFRSAVQVYGARVLALVLSGMGNDGLVGAGEVSRGGGQVLVQDRESALVWGMPGFVAGAGLAEAQLGLAALRQAMQRRAWVGRTRAVPAPGRGA